MNFDLFKPFNFPFFFLKTLGVYQSKSSSRAYKVYGFLMILIILVFSAFCHTMHIVRMIKHCSFRDFSEILIILCTVYAIAFKSIWFLVKLEKIEEIMKTLENLFDLSSFGRPERKTRLEAKVRKLDTILKLYYSSAFVAVTTAAIVSFVKYKERTPTFKTWFFLDYKASDLNYLLLASHECIAAFYGSSLITAFDIVPVIFMALTSELLRELSTELSMIGIEQNRDNEDVALTSKSAIKAYREAKENILADEKANKKLQACIEIHLKIKSFSKDISDHLSFVAFVNASMNTIILCTSASLLTTVRISIFKTFPINFIYNFTNYRFLSQKLQFLCKFSSTAFKC
jgi:hypothetical protein